MGTETTLVLSFLDTAGNEVNVTVKNPKLDLELSTVVAAMETIIDNQGLVSNKSLALDAVNTCYYKAVTKTVLTDDGGGE